MKFIAIAAALFAMIPLLASKPVSAAPLHLPGTYRLLHSSVKFVDTGEVLDNANGPDAKGYIMYGEDRRMLVLITSGDRPHPESVAKTTDAQRLALYNTMSAYGGTYDFDGKTVTHHFDICSNGVWCGSDVVRDVAVVGDTLVYTTRPAPFGPQGRVGIQTLIWKKVK
jgi:hypothetical protein